MNISDLRATARHVAWGCVATLFLSLKAVAAPSSHSVALLEALRVQELMEIMYEEGVAYADELEEELFPRQGGLGWQTAVGTIYDPQAMYREFSEAFDATMAREDAEVLTEFFLSDRGRRIVGLELDARRAFLDPTIEDAAIQAFETAREEGGPFVDALDAFVEVNDLVESNVTGALNSNFAFYQGLNDGGAFPRRMSEGEILADIWSQEGDLRADSIEWVYAYLSLAYSPLDAGDLDLYTALSDSDAGQALNAALFAGFDRVFVRVSRELGEAAAGFMTGQEL